jgi:ribosomal protein S18 acetylase RimI-like enzyme
MKIRKAKKSDISFLAKIILESESTGFEMYSYSSLFKKSYEELKAIFEKVLDNDFEGHGLTYKNFYVVEIKGQLAGGMSFYAEGSHGDSNHLMTGALMQVIDRKELVKSFAKLKDYRDIDIPKTPGTFQLDSVAIMKEYQGQGVFGELFSFIDEQINSKSKKMEVQVWKNNTNAIKAYKKYGFRVEKVLEIEGNGRILMIKE